MQECSRKVFPPKVRQSSEGGVQPVLLHRLSHLLYSALPAPPPKLESELAIFFNHFSTYIVILLNLLLPIETSPSVESR